MEMDFQDCEEAKENLRVREGNISEKYVGFWPSKDEIPGIETWAKSKGVEAVLWTALPPKFNGVINRRPTLEDVITYLQGLEDTQKCSAQEYICKTPEQIKTPFRAELG